MDKVSFSERNHKLGHQVLGLAFPLLITCREDAPCKKQCYACKGNQMYPSVKNAYARNLKIWQSEPELFFKQINAKIFLSDYKYFRLFDSGDIPNTDFFIQFIKNVALKNKKVKFLVMTKKYEIVNECADLIPKNFTVIFSAWDKNWNFPNPHNFPVSFVKFKKNEMNVELPQKALKCTKSCTGCYKCWKLKKGEAVIFEQH